MIYEGTNGIQAMDLLGRKLGIHQGRPLMDLFAEIQKTVAAAKENPAIRPFAEKLEEAANKLGQVAMHMGAMAMSEKVLTAFALANPFLDVCGDVVMAWMLLWRALVSAGQLEDAKKKDRAYYEGQIKSAEYFLTSVLPITLGKMDVCLAGNAAVVEISEDSFGGK
jgi:hypothetical protein